MIDKANDIYNRWSSGQELPTIVLRHTTDESSDYWPMNGGYTNGSGQLTAEVKHSGQQNQYGQPPQTAPTQSDSFMRSHRSLAQCIGEVHQRAKALFPMRKPCQCSSKVAQNCPPSHSWSLPPNIPSQTSPVLPPSMMPFSTRVPPSPSAFSGGIGIGNDTNGTSRAYSPATNGHQSTIWQGIHNMSMGEGIYSSTVLPLDGPPIPPPLSPSSKMAVVDTINFELGALNSNTDQNWMAFF